MTAPCAGMVPPPCAIPPAKAKHSASQVTHPNRTKNGRCPGLACGRGRVCRDGSGRHVHVHGQLYCMPGLQLRVVGCLQLPVRVRVCPPFVLRLSPLVPAGCEAAPPWPAARKRRYKLQQYRRRCGCMRGRAARTVCVLLTPCLQQVWQRRPNAREHHQEYLALHILCAFSHLRHRVLDIPRPGDPRLVQRHGRDLL